MKIGFIGAGTVGTALAVGLSRRGYDVVAVSSRSMTSAERLAALVPGCLAFADNQAVADAADLVFITTPDGAIPDLVSSVNWRSGQAVVHCSGADSTAVLEPARRAGADTGASHPLQTFASVEQAIENMPGSTFAIEAQEPFLNTLKEMVSALDGQSIELQASDKVIYHAAAVMACNYMVTLVKQATDLWQTFGVPVPQATAALMPLLKGTINNIEKVGIPDCLTGPVARADTGTITKHISALGETAPEALSTYIQMGKQTIPVALAKGKISTDQAAEMEKIFSNKN